MQGLAPRACALAVGAARSAATTSPAAAATQRAVYAVSPGVFVIWEGNTRRTNAGAQVKLAETPLAGAENGGGVQTGQGAHSATPALQQGRKRCDRSERIAPGGWRGARGLLRCIRGRTHARHSGASAQRALAGTATRPPQSPLAAPRAATARRGASIAIVGALGPAAAAGGAALALASRAGLRRWQAARRAGAARRALVCTGPMTSTAQLCVVTFNIRGVMDRWPERAPLLAATLADADADVVCFQEVLTGDCVDCVVFYPLL
jgi:hypothetical protein